MRPYGLILITLFVVAGIASAQTTISLWPNGTPESNGTAVPDKEFKDPGTRIVGGRGLYYIKEVSKPTLTVYHPTKVKDTGATSTKVKDTGATSLVFPGGAYQRLAYDLEGTEVCDWLNSLGVTCVVVKYRVPFDKHYPDVVEDLEDAQQAMRITREHAAEWHIDPQRIGATGFSAGAHLAVILGNHPDFKKEGASETPESKIDARPNFVLVIYPGYLSNAPDVSKVTPSLGVSASTPPSFIVQTEDDGAHVENSLLYFKALKDAGVKAEMHLFAEGGHGYGLRPTEFPVSHWSSLAETWLHTIHMLGAH